MIGTASQTHWDVVVLGSGSAGLTAALTTSTAGLSTLIVEKSNKLGGTSAMSAGGVWIPANHHARAAGLEDSPAEALEYIRAAAPAGWEATEYQLWKSFTTHAPQMLAFVEQKTPLRFALTSEPDPLSEFAGAKQVGRMLSPRPLSRSAAGRYRQHLRLSTQPHIFTYHELIDTDLYHHPIQTTVRLAPRLIRRWITDQRGQGTALIAGLMKGCLDQGCQVELGCRAIGLAVDSDGRVVGVNLEQSGRPRRTIGTSGVVIATGGFEWDAKRLAKHFPGPIDFIGSPRSNSGDGHRMAELVGAELAHMDQANINSAIPSYYEGQPHGMALFYHAEPNAILVDRTGRRFVNELIFNLGEVLDRRDGSGQPVHLPAWLVTDARFIRRSPVIRWYAKPNPGWLVRAPTIPALASQINLPPDTLSETVSRFNAFSAAGRDDDFGRPTSVPPSHRQNHGRVGFEAIKDPPYVAISFNRSILATKGGPRTNERGQVLRPNGTVIPGLYCAGVAMANAIGTRAVGAGTTLGPNMTWGYICGLAISGRLPARELSKGA